MKAKDEERAVYLIVLCGRAKFHVKEPFSINKDRKIERSTIHGVKNNVCLHFDHFTVE